MNNLNELLTDYVKVERPQQTKSASGQIKNSGMVIVYSKLKCSIQPYKNWMSFGGAGQTFVDMKSLFCDVSDIKVNDIITDSLGNQYKVSQVNILNIAIPHMKLVITGGVI